MYVGEGRECTLHTIDLNPPPSGTHLSLMSTLPMGCSVSMSNPCRPTRLAGLISISRRPKTRYQM